MSDSPAGYHGGSDAGLLIELFGCAEAQPILTDRDPNPGSVAGIVLTMTLK